jgi:lipid-A-disaccharide synthase
MPRLLISCGEPSGDLYAAELVRHLRARLPGLDAFGLGGDRLQAQETRLLGHVRDLAVVGIVEVVSHLGRLRRIFRDVLAEVDRDPPDVAVLIDYPDFNMRLARELKRRKIKVAYYVSPQVWAWRGGRIRTLRETVARMVVIFPFEEDLYRRADVPVTFVGHPLVDLARPAPDRTAFLTAHGLDPARAVIALLPGSRRKEVALNLPPLVGAVDRLRAAAPERQFLLAVAPSLDPGLVKGIVADRPVALATGQTHAVLGACDVAIVASGTATVEAALLDAPMVVVYRLSPLTYLLGRRLVKVPHFAMVNLIAGRRVVPELIQHEFTPARVAAEVEALLDSGSPAVREMREGLAEVRSRLGGPGASERAALAVLGLLTQKA